METQISLEWLEQQAKKDDSQIDSFLHGTENEYKIRNVLSTENFYNELEKFLNDAKLLKKTKLKNQLNECKNEEEIKSVLIENLYKETWYNITSGKIITNISEEESSINNNQQANEDIQQASENFQQANKNIKQANKNIKQANENVQKTNEKFEGSEALKTTLLSRQTLVDELPDLDKKTNKGSELFQATKSEFEQNWIIKHLKDSKHDETFIDNYILVHTTLKELQGNEHYREVDFTFFEKLVKNLDNACNIPDTNRDSFTKQNIAQTRKELFNEEIWNKTLIAEKENNKNRHSEKYNEVLWTPDEKEILDNYGKFIDDDNLKRIFNAYLADKDNYKNSNLENYNMLIDWVKAIKNKLDESTKNLVEEMVLIAPIKWIFSCIWKPYSNEFELNKAREIENQNWKLNVDLHIEWIKLSIRHNTQSLKSRMQVSSTISKDEKNFIIWESYENSPFILPNKEVIFDTALSCITTDMLRDSSDTDSYLEWLQNSILEKMDNLYKDTEYTHHYIKNKIEWEKVSKKSIWLIQDIKKADIWWIVFDRDEKLFNFINSINFNIQNSTFETKQTMFNCISKIQDIIKVHTESDMKHIDYPDIIKHFLANKTIITDTEHLLKWEIYDSTNVWTVFDLFKEYEINSYLNDWHGKIIDWESLWKDLNWTSSSCSLIAQERSDKEKSNGADTDLENALSDMA